MTFNTQDLCGRLDESRGYNMNTCSGKPVWPKDPRAADIRVEDVSASLSRICRYNGHLKRWQFVGPFNLLPRRIEVFSVAQHSNFVEQKVREKIEQQYPSYSLNHIFFGVRGEEGVVEYEYTIRELLLAALLHDAAEYVLGDMIKPQKSMYAERKPYEKAWDKAVAQRFFFDVRLFDHPYIKEADYRAFLTEQRDLLKKGSVDFGVAEADPYPDKIVPVLPSKAHRRFMKRFNELYRGE